MTASRRTWRMHLRVEHALLISCLIHALILSLKFDLAGLGLPGNLFSNALPQPGEVSLRVTIASQPSSVAAPSQAFAERIAQKSPLSASSYNSSSYNFLDDNLKYRKPDVGYG